MINNPLDVPIDVFFKDASTRTRNAIKSNMDGIAYYSHTRLHHVSKPFTVRHLMMFKIDEICRWPSVGNHVLMEICDLLIGSGLKLANHDSYFSKKIVVENDHEF